MNNAINALSINTNNL